MQNVMLTLDCLNNIEVHSSVSQIPKALFSVRSCYFDSFNWWATFTNWDKFCIRLSHTSSPICCFTLRWTSIQRGIALRTALRPFWVAVTILVRWSFPDEILINPCLSKTDRFLVRVVLSIPCFSARSEILIELELQMRSSTPSCVDSNPLDLNALS